MTPGFRFVIVVVVMLVVVGPLAAQTEYEQVRLPSLRLLGAQLQVGQEDAARDSLRSYLDRYPGDAVMQYNLACLIALDGDHARALGRIDVALKAGYRDLRRLLQDPDLAPLHDDPRLHAALDSVQDTGIRTMLDRQIDLAEGQWSGWAALDNESVGSATDQAGQPLASVRLRYDHEGLEVELSQPAGGADDVFLTISEPRNLREFESNRWTEFHGHLAAEAPLDRIARDGRRDREPMAGTVRASSTGWTLSLPWESLHPDRPPIELFFGINVTVRRGTAAPRTRWSLIHDPFAGSAIHDWRAYVPTSLDPGPTPEPLVAGRLERYLVVGDTLSVELGMQGLPGGRYGFHWHTGADGAVQDTMVSVPIDPDLAYVTMPLDLASLPHGWFDVAVTVQPPDHHQQRWSDRGYRISPNWFLALNEQAEQIPAPERAMVQYHLFRVLRGQETIQPDDDPGPLARSVEAADSLLARWRRTGRILSDDAGVHEGAFPLGTNSLQPCRLVLPAHGRRAGLPLVIVVTDDPDLSGRLASLLAATGQMSRIFVVISSPDDTGDTEAAISTVLAAAGWARQMFATNQMQLVGLGTSSGTCLRALTLTPESWSSALLVTDIGFDPWVLGSPRTTARMVAMSLADLSVDVVLPEQASNRAKTLAEAMAGLAGAVTITQRQGSEDYPAEWVKYILLAQ